MTAIVWLAAGFFASCASAPLVGSVCHNRTVAFGEVGAEPRWNLVPGSDTVIVVFTEDGTPNEELLVQLPSEVVAAGGRHALSEASQVYYQRGGQVRTFASRNVSGTLELGAGGGKGTAQLVADRPEVDVQNVGKVERLLVFEAVTNDRVCH